MKRALICILLLSAAAVLVVHFRTLYGLSDDSFISFRYSKNLADGHGLRWNRFDEPVEGYTNFLWVLIGAAVHLVRPDSLPQIMSCLGILLFFLTGIVFLRLLPQEIPERKGLALFFGLYFCVSGPLVLWSTSGLETLLFAFLISLGALFFKLYLLQKRDRYYALLWGVALLLFLTRPDGLLFGLACGIAFLVEGTFFKKRRLWTFCLAFLLPFAIYNLWRVTYFDSLLPNTFYAKATGNFADQAKKGLLYLKDFSLTYALPLVPLLLYSLRKKTARLLSPFQKWVLVFLALFSLYIVMVGGDYMALYRFFAPLLPLLYFLTVTIFARSLNSHRLFGWSLFGLSLIVTFLPSTPLDKPIWGGNKTYHFGCYEGTRAEQWYVNRFITMGRVFRRLKISDRDTVVTSSIGAFGYYSEMEVIDYFGLTDPHIARVERKTFIGNFPGHEKTDIDYILSKKPTYLIAYKRLFPKEISIDHSSFEEIYVKGDARRRALVREHYAVRNLLIKDSLNKEAGYLSFLVRKDIPEQEK